MTKTQCGEHRKVGYAYSYDSTQGGSSLACKACGLPPEQHETMSETIDRLIEGKNG